MLLLRETVLTPEGTLEIELHDDLRYRLSWRGVVYQDRAGYRFRSHEPAWGAGRRKRLTGPKRRPEQSKCEIRILKTACVTYVNSNLHRSGLTSSRQHIFQGSSRVRSVKNGCPCDDPVTPGPDRVSHVIEADSTIDLNRQWNP